MKEISTDEVADYVLEHHPYAWMWDEEGVRYWIRVFAAQGLLECITLDGKTIAGVAMFRPMTDPKDAADHYYVNPKGDYIFIDFFCGETNEIQRGLLILLIERLGTKRMIAWERHNTIRSYNMRRLVQHALKKERI